jgi:monofunctional glycosyltransferase
VKKLLKIAWRAFVVLVIVYFGTSVCFVVLYRFVNPPVTPLMLIRMVEQTAGGQPAVMKKKWVDLDQISPNLQLAVVASEDNKFTTHRGFDFEAIDKAMDFNERKHGRAVRGASTISQQVAKNVFLWPRRSWLRKGLETYFTIMIELVWGKRRIMEVYLNVIEMGNGIYGAEMASRTYFGKPSSKLSRTEAASLAAILPNPLKWNPAAPTSYLINRREWILWNMGNIGQVSY